MTAGLTSGARVTMRPLLLAGCCAVGCSRGEHRGRATPPAAPVTVEAPPAASPARAPTAPEGVDADAAIAWREVPFADLCVTSGAVSPGVDGAFITLGPTFRAVDGAASEGGARLTFEYVGSTDRVSAPGSGVVHRQIGLKLRAKDPCNVLEVVWRLSPVDDVVVAMKHNPGQSTSAACGEHGYTTVAPVERADPPAIVAGSDHVVEARIDGPRLDVFIDEALVWRGNLTPEADRLRGPVGVRSDNVKARGRLSVAGEAGQVLPCRIGRRAD